MKRLTVFILTLLGVVGAAMATTPSASCPNLQGTWDNRSSPLVTYSITQSSPKNGSLTGTVTIGSGTTACVFNLSGTYAGIRNGMGSWDTTYTLRSGTNCGSLNPDTLWGTDLGHACAQFQSVNGGNVQYYLQQCRIPSGESSSVDKGIGQVAGSTGAEQFEAGFTDGGSFNYGGRQTTESLTGVSECIPKEGVPVEGTWIVDDNFNLSVGGDENPPDEGGYDVIGFPNMGAFLAYVKYIRSYLALQKGYTLPCYHKWTQQMKIKCGALTTPSGSQPYGSAMTDYIEVTKTDVVINRNGTISNNPVWKNFGPAFVGNQHAMLNAIYFPYEFSF